MVDDNDSIVLPDDKQYPFKTILGCDVPEPFIDEMAFGEQIAMVGRWIPFRFTDFDQQDNIKNPSLYNKIVSLEVPSWVPIDPDYEEGLPF